MTKETLIALCVLGIFGCLYGLVVIIGTMIGTCASIGSALGELQRKQEEKK